MEDYKKLVEQYKEERPSSTHREQARLERRIWDAAVMTLPKTDGALRSKREWLSKELGESPHHIEAHSALLGYGDAADPMWERVQERGLPIRTAVGLMREAKDRARATKKTLEDSVAEVLEEYESLPAFRLPGGGVIHKRSPSMLPRTPQPSESKTVEEEDETSSMTPDDQRSFWANLRGMISGYFHTRLGGLDQGAVEKVWREMDVELKVVLEHFQHKIDRMRRDGASQKVGLSRSKIVQACGVLNLEPPPLAKPIDEAFKKKAKSQFRKLASVYHPDKSRTEDTRPLYDNVVEAYRLLEDL